MKKIFLLLMLTCLLSGNSGLKAQIDVFLSDIETGKDVYFTDIWSEYDLDPELPTVLITWSGEWCAPCLSLISRYNQCDLSFLNVLTVNVDQEESREKILAMGYQKKWTNCTNFHANLGEDKKGFDNVFNVSHAPLIIIIEEGQIRDAIVSYALYPYLLYKHQRVNDIGLIMNSSLDLNSLAWSYYNDESSSTELEMAIGWVKRSIDLDKNYYNTHTYAALLYKTGEYTQALKVAKEAIEIAKEEEDDYDSANELIQLIIDKL